MTNIEHDILEAAFDLAEMQSAVDCGAAAQSVTDRPYRALIEAVGEAFNERDGERPKVAEPDLTPAEVVEETRRLREKIGGDVYVSTMIGGSKTPALVCVYPHGLTVDRARFEVSADRWDRAFALAFDKWDEMRGEFMERRTTEMAVEIIKATHLQGACSDAALRAAGFTQAEIDEMGNVACVEANKMGESGPFTIKRIGVANGAPDAA